MNNLRVMNYYSIADGIEWLTQTKPSPWTAKLTNIGFFDYLKRTAGIPFVQQDTTHTSKLFQVYVFPKYYKEFIYRDEAEEFDSEVAIDVNGAIYTWLMATKDNYSYLIETYENERDNLLNQLKTTTQTTASDTPQELGSWEDDEYVSSRSGTTTSTDAGTLISRIDEIRRKITNIYEEWANEFREFIIWQMEVIS